MTFLNAIEEFNKWRSLKVKRIDGYDLDLRQFSIFLRNPELEDINDKHIVEWLTLYKNAGFSQNTLIKKAEALRKFFEYYRRSGFDVIDPWLIPLPKKVYPIPRVATEEDYKKLLSAIPDKVKSNCYQNIRNRLLINLIWETGMRIGEAVALNLDDLDFRSKTVIIRTEKSKGMRPFRQIPWHKDTEKSLPVWLKLREKITQKIILEDSNALFIGIKGGYRGHGARGKRLASSAAGEVFRKLSNKAGMEQPVNAHSLRHHMGHNLAMNHADNSVISETLGHASIQSSYQYTMLHNVNLVSTLRKIFTRKGAEKVKR